MTESASSCTLVLDIGKSNAKLLLIDEAGAVVARRQRPNVSEDDAELGARVLGVERLSRWLREDIPTLPRRSSIDRISITTHGAAFCGLDPDAPGGPSLALPPLDYEWDGYGEVRDAFERARDPFAHSGTPVLPLGLVAGLQLEWVRTRHPQRWAKAQVWLPYAQYWAWWFSGVACSEVSSLGCHTALWHPAGRRPSDWACQTGIAERLAPERPAWATIGHLRPHLSREWGLRDEVRVLAGSHDSNACLARYLERSPDATVVSTGTWCIAMAPGAALDGLDPGRDQLVNVAVDGRPVATGRFMGGREFGHLCGGVDPGLATAEALRQVLIGGWMALPTFSDAGGPFVGREGRIVKGDERQPYTLDAVPSSLRPALAALYAAEMTVFVSTGLASSVGGGLAPVILEGPLAGNEAYRLAMAGLLAPRQVLCSSDELEGTARGAWMLAHWGASRGLDACELQPLTASPTEIAMLADHHTRWRSRVVETGAPPSGGDRPFG